MPAVLLAEPGRSAGPGAWASGAALRRSLLPAQDTRGPRPGPAERRALLTRGRGSPAPTAPRAGACRPDPRLLGESELFFGLSPSPLRSRRRRADPATWVSHPRRGKRPLFCSSPRALPAPLAFQCLMDGGCEFFPFIFVAS